MFIILIIGAVLITYGVARAIAYIGGVLQYGENF